MTGFVYAIEAADGLIKIGHTTDPHRRLAAIQTDNHSRLRLVGCVSATVAQEQELHELLARSREIGEWFRPSAAVMAAVSMFRPWVKPDRRHYGSHPLARYRRDAKLSRREIADAAKTTRQTIHRIERGEQQPSWELAARLIAVTQGAVTANDFMPVAAE